MAQIQKYEKQIVIKSNSIFLYLLFGAAFMAAMGLSLLFDMLPLREEHGVGDFIGVIFLLFWISGVLWIGFNGLIHYTKKIIIDENGVTYSTILKKEQYAWSEIHDYGLSYLGQVHGGGNTYEFYFSKQIQKQKNECKKKLKGNLIKISIFDTDYHIAIETVIPFCKNYTTVKPFVGVDKYHIV